MQCAHMQAAGNDFVVLDGRKQNLNLPDLAVKLCKTVGADGFMALDVSEMADFRMHFYNCDGSRAAMCGNGSRCICKFAYDLGLAGENMIVQTDAGVITGKRLEENLYQVNLPTPRQIQLQMEDGTDFCICGVPHAVVQVQELSREKLIQTAQRIRKKWDCNVNFFTPVEDQTVRVFTYERGVEDFTPACGTGCGAVTAIRYAAGFLPGRILTAINPGGILKMEVQPGNCSILQTGAAEILNVFDIV